MTSGFPTDFTQARIIPAPDDPADVPQWRGALRRWREETRTALGYSGERYARPEFAWGWRCFACPFVLLWDELLTDHRSGRYTPERYLEYARAFGGMDALVLWHAYPNLGFDERNQFDFYRDAPGGLEGLRALIQAFHRHGVRVFLGYNPWDTGTRREGLPDYLALADVVGRLEADGVFLDTLRHSGREFRQAIDALRPGVVFESESSLPLEHLHDHAMSWAQWFRDSRAPGVLRNKWLEPRHMMHHTRRWDRDHREELQSAWMNGAGILVWENVFGSWNGWHARDRWLLRLMLPVQRRYAEHFALGEWCPLVETEVEGVYATAWTHDGSRLWTLVNRDPRDVQGALLEVPHRGERYFDLIEGRELETRIRGHRAVLRGEVAGHGLGAVVTLDPSAVDTDFRAFLERQRRTYAERSDDTRFPQRPIALEPAPPSARREAEAGTIRLGPAQPLLRTTFRNRECGTYGPAPFVNVWKPKYPHLHQPVVEVRQVRLGAFALDPREVSNREYQTFLAATGYTPRDPERFLAHWQGGAPHPTNSTTRWCS